MPRRVPVGFAALAVCTFARHAAADFQCSRLELVADDGPGGLWTWRVYLDFDDPLDSVEGVGGIPDLWPIVFDSEDPLWNDGGVFSGLKTEDFPAGDFSHPRDSWVTIDHLGFPNLTDYSPGFAGSDGVTNIIKGDHFEEDNGGWFPGPTKPVTGTHVLIAQFTLPSGSDFILTGMVLWVDGLTEILVMSQFQAGWGCPPPECPGDVNQSGAVDFVDLLLVLGEWGPCKGCPTDLDGSGDVGLPDLLTVLAAWGACP